MRRSSQGKRASKGNSTKSRPSSKAEIDENGERLWKTLEFSYIGASKTMIATAQRLYLRNKWIGRLTHCIEYVTREAKRLCARHVMRTAMKMHSSFGK
jgi:hypothetical protein